MPLPAKNKPDPSTDLHTTVAAPFPAHGVTAPTPTFAKRRSFRSWLRQATVRATSPAVIGTPSALNKIRLPGSASPVLVPVAVAVAPEWDRRIARVEGLIRKSKADHLIVALPLPSGCYSEIALARMIVLDGPVSLVDTDTPTDEDKTRPKASFLSLAIKELIDRLGAALLLTVLWPLMLFVAALIRLTSHGPALFIQPRLGRHNRVIPVVKFRTMYDDQGDRLGGCATVPNDPRVTPLGRVLRRWSIDELPQLFNVLVGQMSLVGPRPHAVMMKAGERLYFEALPAYLSRHSVKPGITGWAQVNRLSGQVDSLEGGHARLICDLHYIDNWSLWLDLKILFMTPAVFFDRVNRY